MRFEVDYTVFSTTAVVKSGVHVFNTVEEACDFIDDIETDLPEELDLDYEITTFDETEVIYDLSKLDMF